MEQEGALPASPDLGPGVVVDGRFRLASLLLRSSHSLLFSAIDERSRQRVRVRITSHAALPALVTSCAAQSVVGHGAWGRWHYVALEWFDGDAVALVVPKACDRAHVQAWARDAIDLLDALERIHTASGRAHGNLTLESIWRGVDGRLRILDATAPDAPLSLEAVPYASPERLRGEPLDLRSDLYAAGCILYALAAGSPPFGDEPIEARAGHFERRMPALNWPVEPGSQRLEPLLPTAYSAILRTSLEKQRHHRFGSAGRMSAALGLAQQALDHSCSGDPTVIGLPAPDPGDLGDLGTTLLGRAVDRPEYVDPELPAGTLAAAPTRQRLPPRMPVNTRLATPAATPRAATPRAATPRAVSRPQPSQAPPEEPQTVLRAVARSAPADKRRSSGSRSSVTALVLAACAVGVALASLGAVLSVVLLALVAANDPQFAEATAMARPTPAPVAVVAPVEPSVDAAVDAEDVATSEAEAISEAAAVSAALLNAPLARDVPVDFPYDAYRPVERATFPEFVSLVREHEGNVLLTGHTDSLGPAEVNQQMGLGRAWAVQRMLVLLGIAVPKVPIASKGETEPIADNATPAGRAKNRRVTAEFLEAMPALGAAE